MSIEPTISFIIPVLNAEEYIERCLDHIQSESLVSDEIIVIDNGSTDRTLDILRAQTQLILLESPDVTIAALRNTGAEKATGELLAFIDADCLICPGWRNAVINVMADRTIGATGATYDLPEDPTWVERTWWSYRRKVRTDVHFINSGNLIVRSSLFESIGGFNEELITDEDTEIGRRIRDNGHRIVEEPTVRAIHLGNAKTLVQFVCKEKWHSTSILETMRQNGVDKPMLMTITNMFMSLVAICWFLASLVAGNLIWQPLILLAVIPVFSSLYRNLKYRTYRYFFSLIPLYFIFYSVRSITIIESLFAKR